jgi:hypothetical protein
VILDFVLVTLAVTINCHNLDGAKSSGRDGNGAQAKGAVIFVRNPSMCSIL